MPGTIHLPTIRQLRHLVALRDHGGFARAAEALGIGQSTLSGSIAELEGLLGETLVERNRRIVRFTRLGEDVAVRARRVVAEAQGIADAVLASREPLTGETRMSVIPTIAPFVLPRALPRLKRAYPDLRLHLREETSAEACASLQDGRIDCVLLAFPFPCGEVDCQVLYEDPIMVAFHEDEALGDADEVIPSAIDASRLLLLEDGHCLKGHALTSCNRPDFQREARMTGTSLQTVVSMVDGGLGVTMIPGMAVEAGILDGTDVVARPLRADRASRRIALVWRKDSPRSRDFGLLASFLASMREPSDGKDREAA